MTHQFVKPIRKKLRELAGLAHKRELSRALETLDKHFAQWHRQEIDCFELNDRIHSFHQKTSRELWKTYSSMEDDFLVCRAVKLGGKKGLKLRVAILSEQELVAGTWDGVEIRRFVYRIEIIDDLKPIVHPVRYCQFRQIRNPRSTSKIRQYQF